MKLTGEAKENFWKWYLSEKVLKENKLLPMLNLSNENVIRINFLAMPEVCQHSLIIDFFDEQWIVTTITNTYYDGFHFQWKITDNRLKTHKSKHGFESRKEATEKAIEKSNEIYNDKNK